MRSRSGRERHAQSLRLGFDEAGAEAQDQPPSADGIQGSGGFGGEDRIAKGGVEDDEADANSRDRGGERGANGETIESRRRPAPAGQHVFAGPERIETEGLG